MSDVQKRSRSYEWIGTEHVGAPLAGRSGLRYFQDVRDGHIPAQPIAATIGWKVIEVESGMLRLSLVAEDHLFHGGGMLHGGVMATLLDSAMAGAIMSTLPAGAVCATLDLHVQYLKAVRGTHTRLTACGRVTSRAGRVATSEAAIEDQHGVTHARATATFLVTESGKA